MNRERLIELRDFLANHPDRFNYGCWVKDQNTTTHIHKPSKLLADADLPKECGTIGCVAGWAVALFSDAPDEHDWNIEDHARHLLELDIGLADRLFLNFHDSSMKIYGVDEAIRRINELLDTGYIGWSKQ